MARTPKIVEDRREQIIDAAMRIFAQKGFTKATNKDIAREAGITAGLIYHYFKSKEDLLKVVIEERSPLQLLTSLPAEAFALPPEQFFRFLLIRVLNIVEEEKFVSLLRVVVSEALHGSNEYVIQIAPMVLQRALGFIESYIDAQIASGALRQVDSALAAQVLLGSMIGFVLRRQVLRDAIALQYTHEEIVEVIVDTVLKGLSPR
ncbi:MAG: TetR/AcrR family transcriptional regulator [Ktedonobacteraceae bacterium]